MNALSQTSFDPRDPRSLADRANGPALSDAAFARIATIAHREAGLAISASKSAMVRTRLSRRLRALGLRTFEDYCSHIESPEGRGEVAQLISALTTNVSHFFREGHHFEILKTQVLPPLVARARAGERVRVWSAGCSNGQEPYSIAMAMVEAGMPLEADVKILASDIDPNVVGLARSGFYAEEMMSGLSDELRARHFEKAVKDRKPGWQIDDRVRNAVAFRVLNLLDKWPMQGRFDAIFCRNVVIYFDAETKDKLWHRFANQLVPGGWLFIGHSERLSPGAQSLFSGQGITAYRRTEGRQPPSEGHHRSEKGS